jgi:hypothetical protein
VITTAQPGESRRFHAAKIASMSAANEPMDTSFRSVIRR